LERRSRSETEFLRVCTWKVLGFALLVWPDLGWPERLAAFHAGRLVAWSNQAAKRTHPLRSSFPDLRDQYRQKFGGTFSEEGESPSQPIAKLIQGGSHLQSFILQYCIAKHCLSASRKIGKLATRFLVLASPAWQER